MENIQQQFVEIFGTEWGGMLFSLVSNMIFIFAIVIPLLLGVAYLTFAERKICLLYTSPSPRDRTRSRMPSSA